MQVTTILRVGEPVAKQTVGDILRPTKGQDSYARIANRANAWLSAEVERGRSMPITRTSSEQVRKIFEDLTARPDPIYLEALAAVQKVNLRELYDAAGYPTVILQNGRPVDHTEPEPEELLKKYVKACRGKMDKGKLIAHILEILEEEEREDAGGQD